MKNGWLRCAVFAAACAAVAAAEPPDLVNYQGVLRDAADNPLNGSYDMVFRFFDAETAGNEILIDRHTSAQGGQVSVADGLFSATLGGGSVVDGSGPGTYTSLAAVFADHGAVFLEMEVSGEVLTPRMRVLSAPYAFNADQLAGRGPDGFLRTGSAAQTKSGEVSFENNGGGGAGVGVRGYGPVSGGYFQDTDQSGYAYVGVEDEGIQGFGSNAGGYFGETDSNAAAWLAAGNVGIQASANGYGGHFSTGGGTGWARIAYQDYGVAGYGSVAGGHFECTDGTSFSHNGYPNFGVVAKGVEAGAYFAHDSDAAFARLGWGEQGISASGSEAGGTFAETDTDAQAILAAAGRGVEGIGTESGAYFKLADESATATLAWNAQGITAKGDSVAARFDNNAAGSVAEICSANYGVHASGTDGAHFSALDGAAYAYIGTEDHYGVAAYGDDGGYFHALDDQGVGVVGFGHHGGGYFEDLGSGNYTRAGYDTYKVAGTGTVNFIQNHPERPGQVIVYAAPEGDEVAVYTRGTARLVDGTARVALADTFRWVANPEIGLTAHLTARGEPVPLSVGSLSTSELLVRGPDGSDASFDYLVYGLRVGFEDVAVVQEKTQDAKIPSMATHHELLTRRPDLAGFTARSRFAAMVDDAGVARAPGGAAAALLAAIGVHDPADGPIGARPPRPAVVGATASEAAPDSPEPADIAQPTELIASSSEPTAVVQSPPAAEPGESEVPSYDPETLFPTVGAVRRGDLLQLDPLRSGYVRLAGGGLAPVIGVALADPVEIEGVLQVPVKGVGFATVKADATAGAIAPGDWLVSSAVPGHVAKEKPDATARVAKAAEALEAGFGLIRVLLIPR